MKRTNRLSILAVLLATTAAFLFAADVSGTWTATFDTQVGQQPYTFMFKQDGMKLTGTAKNTFTETDVEITDGKVDGDTISFVENMTYQGMPLRITYKGTINGDEISFTRNVADFADETGKAMRKK